AVISQHVNTAPVAPSWHNPDVAPSLEALVVRLLAKAPGERPASATAVLDELRRIAAAGVQAAAGTAPAEPRRDLAGVEWGRFVGRGEEMEQLKGLLARALSGKAALAMLVGEPGIGKTRLAEEFAVYAELRGARALSGRAYEGEASVPYRPFVEALRGYIDARSDGELRDELGEGAPDVATLISDVRRRLPDLPPTAPLEGEAERLRLFESVTQFVRNASRARPLVLLLDDLHWADKPSLLLLRHLARSIVDGRVLIVGAYRDVELDRTHPLAEALAAMRRERPYTRVLVRGLPESDVVELIESIGEASDAGSPLRQLGLALYSETEGNPFFIREVVSHLIEERLLYRDGACWTSKVSTVSELGIPEGVREAIGRRLSRLSDGCNRMLSRASAMTAGFSWDELKAISGEDEGVLLDVLEEALGAQLIAERRTGTYDFTHALIRQTLYEELSTPRRVLLHRQIGEALEQLYAANVEPHLTELAHHFYQAASGGDVEKAIDYARRAGDRAGSLAAWEAAAAHYERALLALEFLPVRDDRRQTELRRSRGQAYETLGDFDRARTDYEQAFAAAQAAKDGNAELQSLIDLGFLWSGRDYERTGVYFQRAFELADAIGDPGLRARSMNRLGNWLVNVGRPSEGLAHHASALAIFESEHDTLGTAETLDLMGIANALFGDLPACVEAFSRAIELLRPLGPSIALTSSLTSRAAMSGPNLAEPVRAGPGTREDARRDAAEAAEMAEKIGSPAAMSYAALAGGAAAAAFGDLGFGLGQAAEGLRLATEIGHDQWITGAKNALGDIYLRALAPGEAVEQFDAALQLARELGSAWWIGNATTGLALAHLLRDDTARAEAVLSDFQRRDHEPQNLPERRVRWVWGLLALACGDALVALNIADALLSTPIGGRNDQRIPSLQHLRGDALRVLKRHDEALAALECARDCAIDQGARPSLWQIHRSLGQLHRGQRRPADAEREFGAARALIGSLAATIDDAGLRERFQQSATSSLPHPET
ncbi:MAG: AAA family ATPase, partial [Chloroflexota bacterium]|nr:AAA family ATPase [Chloroflexota bacterium]